MQPLIPGADAYAWCTACRTSDPAIDAMSEQARLVDNPDLSLSTPATELPFGTPAPYWLDLRGYNPVAVAAALDRRSSSSRAAATTRCPAVVPDIARWLTTVIHNSRRPGKH